MRWLAVVSVATLVGCLNENPAFTASDGDASTAAGDTTGGVPTTSTSEPVPTTSLATSDATDATTEGLVSHGSTVTGDEDSSGTTATDETTDVSSSTGEPPAPVCVQHLRIPLSVGVEDAGVVPLAMPNPCDFWTQAGASCDVLNFGVTHYFGLVNDPVRGKNAALFRFRSELVAKALTDHGHDVSDVIGVALALVVWEPLGAPAADYVFDVGLLNPADSDWCEGTKPSNLASHGDSSAKCKCIDQSECLPWTTPVLDSTVVSKLDVTVASVNEDSDEDNLPNEYHARLASEMIENDLGALLMEAANPTFVLSLQSERLVYGPQVGVKFKEAVPWTDPGLVVEVCTEWK